jgi:hypothetical protein
MGALAVDKTILVGGWVLSHRPTTVLAHEHGNVAGPHPGLAGPGPAGHPGREIRAQEVAWGSG